jgi:hypothetical protein
MESRKGEKSWKKKGHHERQVRPDLNKTGRPDESGRPGEIEKA